MTDRDDMRQEVDSLWASWFTGFVDGEGYFQIYESSGKRNYSAKLVITLREDDGEVLNEISERLNCGNVYHVEKKADREKGINSSDQFMWVVGAREEVNEIVIPLFEEYPLRSKKKREFKIWKEAARLIYRGANDTQSGRNKIASLKRQIIAERKNAVSEDRTDRDSSAAEPNEENHQSSLFENHD